MSTKRVVLITGTSSGIGLATAIELSTHAYHVVATMRDISKAHESLRSSACDIQPLDVTDETSACSIVSYLQQKYGRCDVLINNAGYGIHGTIELVTISDAQRVFDVNVWGVMRMCKKIAPLMRTQGGGLILTISSMGGLYGLPYWDIYCASKHAVEGMLESYRYSVFQDNIAVAMMNPGPVRTVFVDKQSGSKNESSSYKEQEYDNVCKKMSMMSDKFEEFMNKRLVEHGQPVEECAKFISDVVDKLIQYNVSNGDLVRFWNPTTKGFQEVLADIKSHPDGVQGIYERGVERIKHISEKIQSL